MNLSSLIKFLIWVVVFSVALGGIYTLLKSVGVIGG